MTLPLRVLLLLSALAGCGSFLVAPSPATRVSASATRPGRTWYRCAQHRRQPSDLRASPRNSQEDLDKARQRLIASSGYDELVNRVEGNSPFVEPGAAGGVEEAGGEAPGLVFVRQVVRVAVDVAIVLVPVVLVVHFVKLPPAVVDALGSAAAAIKASSLEPVLAALPWEPTVVLKYAAQGGVAVLLSPVADRLVVAPAMHLWAQAKLRSLSS